MIKIKKTKKQNPETADFKRYNIGYHVTTERGLDAIQNSGFLKPNSYKNLATFWEADYYGYFGKGFTPLFFAHDIETLMKNFYIQKNSKVLEVNIKDFPQYPDLPMLGNRMKTSKSKNGMYWDYKVPPIFGMLKLNEIVPFEEFFTNERLGNKTIYYTQSVTIMENIPIENILNVWNGSKFV